ncbi:MAG: hypothetical protein P8P36_07545, partial [Akkermansiaceae bacterium]|nr:hypothetical protein [Akkermansiaceae bacterium]
MKKKLSSLTLALALTASSHAVTVFDIVIDFGSSTFTTSQQAAFTNAEATWESLITSYKATSVTPGFQLTISANNPTIDGVGGTLGSAGPTFVGAAGSYLYATAGAMSFDSADVAALETAGTWETVILHEMAHVIGIGTLWSS